MQKILFLTPVPGVRRSHPALEAVFGGVVAVEEVHSSTPAAEVAGMAAECGAAVAVGSSCDAEGVRAACIAVGVTVLNRTVVKERRYGLAQDSQAKVLWKLA